MAAPISLRVDFDGSMLRALALWEKAGRVTRRLLSLVTIYECGTRADAARPGGVGLQTRRDWGLRFNAKGPNGLVDGKSTGRPCLLDDEQRRALVAMIEAGSIPAIHEVVRWRLIDLAQWVFDEYGVSVTKQIMSRELRALGYRKLSARPGHHEHDEVAVADFKKSPRPPRDHRRVARQSGRSFDCRVLWRASRASGFVDGLPAAIAVDVHFEDRGVVRKAVYGGQRHGLAGKDLSPFAEGLIGGDEH